MEPGLDFAFLKFIGVAPENQRPIRQFYLPFFEKCEKVVDLGCGTGDFVSLLCEAGIDAVGIDSDPNLGNFLREQNIPFVEQDVLAYLNSVPPESVDGIYSAHLIEHMPYEQVLKLIRLSYQALRPGGVLVLATPNPRALISHLEMYHMHFGHEAFYHPNLLRFFLDYCGFVNIEDGENPTTVVWSLESVAQETGGQIPIHYQRGFTPTQNENPVRWLSRKLKTVAFRFIVQPFLDDFEDQVNRVFSAHQTALQTTGLNAAFECYALGYKPRH